MGNYISMKKAAIVAGPQQKVFHVSLDLIIKNFRYLKQKKHLLCDETNCFHFPEISGSTLRMVLDFITRGERYKLKV